MAVRPEEPVSLSNRRLEGECASRQDFDLAQFFLSTNGCLGSESV
jgi:hypothetical protein